MKLNKMREEMAGRFIEALKEETIPWYREWSSLHGGPFNAVSDIKYHGINSMWLSFRQEELKSSDPRWCTFKQAGDRGWKIKKGAKGTRIEFWSMYDTKEKQKLSYAEAEKLKVQLGKDFYERVKPMSSMYTVFNGCQIEGIPELEPELHVLDEKMLMEKRNVLLQSMSVGFREGNERAFYRPSEDCIHMPDIKRFENEYAYMSTFLHEAGHATGHESRLNRGVQNIFGTPAYAKEELRAEIASAFTAQQLGFSNLNTVHMDNHKAYIQSWIQVLEKNPEELFSAIKDAEKISDYLLEKGAFIQGKEEILAKGKELTEPVVEEPVPAVEPEKAPVITEHNPFPTKIDYDFIQKTAELEDKLKIPAEDRSTSWFGDYGIYEIKEGMSKEQLQKRYEELKEHLNRNQDFEFLGYYQRAKDGNEYVRYREAGKEYYSTGIYRWEAAYVHEVSKGSTVLSLTPSKSIDKNKMYSNLQQCFPYSQITEYVKKEVEEQEKKRQRVTGGTDAMTMDKPEIPEQERSKAHAKTR